MPNPYSEIFKSYWRHLFSSWFGIIYFLGAVGSFIGSFGLRGPHPYPHSFGPLDAMIMSASLIVWLLWGHFWNLVVNLNRPLLPKSILPNVSVLAAFIFVLAILWPALLRPLFVQILPLVALVSACFAVTGIVALSGSVISLFLGMAFFYWFLYFNLSPFSASLWSFLQGDFTLLAAAIALVSLAAIVAVVVRMVQLDADDPRFQQRFRFRYTTVRPRLTGEVNQSWSQQRGLQLDISLLRLPGIYIPSTNSLWNRAKRWRRLNRGGTGFAFLFVAVITLVQYGVARGDRSGMGLMQTSIFLFFMPPLLVMQSWLRQWRYLEVESLRPMARQTFLAEAALAIAIDLVKITAIFLLCPVIIYFLIPLTPLPAAFFAVAATSLVFNYTLILWWLRWRSINISLPGVLLILILEAPIVVTLQMNFPHHWPALAASALLLIVAAFLWPRICRHWLLVEFG